MSKKRKKTTPLLFWLGGPGSLGLGRCVTCGLDNLPVRVIEQHACDPRRVKDERRRRRMAGS